MKRTLMSNVMITLVAAIFLTMNFAWAQEAAYRDQRDTPTMLGAYNNQTKRLQLDSDGATYSNSSRAFSTTTLTNATNVVNITIGAGATAYSYPIDLGASKLPTNMAVCLKCTSNAARSLTVSPRQSVDNTTWAGIANSAGTMQNVVTSWTTNATAVWFPVTPVSARYLRFEFVNGGSADDVCNGTISYLGQK
jgi:hypothetical protein